MAMNYKRRLRDINTAIENGLYRDAVESAGGALESLLKELLQEVLEAMPPHEQRKLENALQQEQSKRRSMTLGNLIYFFRDNRIYEALGQYLGYKLVNLNDGILQTLLGVRNDCVHDDKTPTRAQAELGRNSLILFLEETGRPVKETGPITAPKPKGQAQGPLPAWAHTVVPHQDIRERRFDMGIFAANIGEVRFGTRQQEYRDPNSFFDLTYITRGLRDQLVNLMRRISGDPKAASVIHLHTTFGGGKTHTMLAMYHVAENGPKITSREDIRQLMLEARVDTLQTARIAVIDGDLLSPSQPRVTGEGITLYTLWGEIAYQLGGPQLYDMIRESDEKRSAPGQTLLQNMLAAAGPSLILMDEILQYATKAATIKVGRSFLVDQMNAFMKALSQAVDQQLQSMLVVTMTSQPQEMFGDQATTLYENLRRILQRVQRTEVIAESDEIYEILRRRLFEDIGPLGVREQVADAYYKYYRDHSDAFPEYTLDPGYRDAIIAAYPFHPDLVDVLRGRWGTISGFQKTRGVLQFLALVVSNLYRRNHGAPLIQVGHVDLADPEIRQQLLNYVDSPHRYDAVIGADIAGLADSKAENLDKRLGRDFYKFGLCEGMASGIFMYSHSGKIGGTTGGTRPQLWLSVLQPGLEPASATDALDRFRQESWYLEEEGAIFRLGITANLNMILTQRLDAMRQDERGKLGLVHHVIEQMDGGKFGKAIIWPDDPRQVRDSDQLKLIIGPLDKPWMEPERDDELAAQIFIDDILNDAGSTHRQYRNTLIFLMPTPEGAQNIHKAAINLMALEDINRTGRNQLNERQYAELQDKLQQARNGLPAAIWGAYIVVVAPSQGQDHDLWVGFDYDLHFGPGDSLSNRAWRVLEDEQRLLQQIDPFIFGKGERFEILWPEGQKHVNVAQLWDHFARYTYLPMLAHRDVLQDSLAWGVDRGLFAYCLGDPETEFDTMLFNMAVSGSDCVISPNAWLLEAKSARKIREAEEQDYDEEPEDDQDDGQEAEPGPETERQRDGYTSLEVDMSLGALDWRSFYNSVIEPLIKAGAKINIQLHLSVSHDRGLDRDLIELRVRESITQIGKNVRIDVK